MPKPIGIPGLKTSACIGKQLFLPPKSPGPLIPPSYVDYNVGHCIGPIGVPRPNENSRHHRTSSESFLVEEQFSWLDDLLNEPDAPIRKGSHRRSTSDSFAYVDMCNLSSNWDNKAYVNYRTRSIALKPSWGPEAFDRLKGLQHPHCIEANSFRKAHNRSNELTLNTVNNLGSSHPPTKKTNSDQISNTKEPEALTSTEPDHEESAQGVQGSSEKTEDSHTKQTQAEMETKRVKQQFAQRSRVRKLQYIAELETNVQVLQAECWEMSAKYEFLSQQNLILSVENKALKQRFDSLSQEHLLKGFEQEMLEREIARIRSFFQHHQQQPQQQQQKQLQRQRQQQTLNSNHGRSDRRDPDMQFSNLSLKRKDASPGRDPLRRVTMLNP